MTGGDDKRDLPNDPIEEGDTASDEVTADNGALEDNPPPVGESVSDDEPAPQDDTHHNGEPVPQDELSKDEGPLPGDESVESDQAAPQGDTPPGDDSAVAEEASLENDLPPEGDVTADEQDDVEGEISGDAGEPQERPDASGDTVDPEGDNTEDNVIDLSEDGTSPKAYDPAMREVLLSRLESLIFTSPEPMTVRKLARILNLEGKDVRILADELKASYRNRGIILEEISKGFQFRSHPDNAAIIRDVFKLKPLKISRAALETLAIVAYRQPLTRAEAEQIRGVDCGGVLKYLFEKNLVRVIGRKEEPGRPIIYGTSKEFLELFGLKALSDLPALHEFSELWDEHQKIVDEETPVVENGHPGENGVEKETQEGTDSGAEAETQEGTTDSGAEAETKEEEPDTMTRDEKAKKSQGKKPDPSELPTETINHEALKELMDNIDPSGPMEDDDAETIEPGLPFDDELLDAREEDEDQESEDSEAEEDD